MRDLGYCLNHIISKGFPELVKTSITASYKPIDDAFFTLDKSTKDVYKIDADKSMKRSGQKVVIGGLAHEVAHIYKDVTGLLPWDVETFLCTVLPFYSTIDERNADSLVIKRGFGSELLSFVKYANKRREKYNFLDGLTEKEILRRIKKTNAI